MLFFVDDCDMGGRLFFVDEYEVGGRHHYKTLYWSISILLLQTKGDLYFYHTGVK